MVHRNRHNVNAQVLFIISNVFIFNRFIKFRTCSLYAYLNHTNIYKKKKERKKRHNCYNIVVRHIRNLAFYKRICSRFHRFCCIYFK